MEETKYQVFVSSTFLDLKKERLKAQEAILASGNIPLGMELFPASPSLWKIIEDQIRESDYYILIIGGRYGSISDRADYSGASYTEIEYELAIKYGVPILPFIRLGYENHKSYLKLVPKDRQKLKKFISKLGRDGRSVHLWKNGDALGQAITSTLKTAITAYPRSGWQKRERTTSTQSKFLENITFECLYYSFIHHQPKSFELKIVLDTNKKIVSAEEVGFHEGPHQKVTYKGTGGANHGYIYLTLIGEYGDLFNLVLITSGGEGTLKSSDIIFGHFQGISSHDPGRPYLANGEFVAIRKNSLDKGLVVDNDKVNLIRQFLMINRVTYRVKSRQLLHPNNWTGLTCKHITISSIQHLIGEYRVLTPIGRETFIQSRLVINKDFSAYFYTENIPDHPNLFPVKQVCLLRSSNFPENSQKLNLTMHEIDGVRVVSNIMIDLPKLHEIDEVLIGSYCNASKSVKKEPFDPKKGAKQYYRNIKIGTKAGFFLAIKWKEEASFSLGKYRLSSLRKEIKTNSSSTILHDVYLEKRDTLFFNASGSSHDAAP